MTTDYSSSHTAPGKGLAYDQEFNESRFLRYLWARERRLLRKLVQKEVVGRAPEPTSYLDFACGTGRILVALEDLPSVAVGVDISDEMLSQARSRVNRSSLVLGDVLSNPQLVPDRYDIATSFRFFPNADPPLRRLAAEFLGRTIRPGGLLIVNNHQNAASLLCGLARVTGKRWPWTEAYNREIIDLLLAVGFRLEGSRGFGQLPGTARRSYLPIPAHRFADSLAYRLGLTNRAQNVVMWFRRT